MAWVDGVDYSTGQLISATIWNNYLGAAGDIDLTAPGVVTAEGDMVYATADNTITRLAKGTDNYVMTMDGNVPNWEAAAGGMTVASQWRISANFDGDENPVTSNWEEVDAPAGFGILGSSMTESSGIFTFPSTGYYWIEAVGQ